MHISSTADVDRRCELRVTGDVDLSVADELRDAAVGLLTRDGCPTLCLDLAGVSFLDSTGIGALVGIRNAARSGQREFVLRDPARPVRRVLALAGLDEVFTFEHTTEHTTEHMTEHTVDVALEAPSLTA